jgi:hypothetical protein
MLLLRIFLQQQESAQLIALLTCMLGQGAPQIILQNAIQRIRSQAALDSQFRIVKFASRFEKNSPLRVAADL